jgi:pyruvate/2-oxoglutarate dehydrogenase complex dihydrolipoamide dehydrogenase (E3) component
MSNAAEAERYQLLVVADGKGGKTLAMDVARSGRSLAMVEHVPEMVGGTRINLACISTRSRAQLMSRSRTHVRDRRGRPRPTPG